MSVYKIVINTPYTKEDKALSNECIGTNFNTE